MTKPAMRAAAREMRAEGRTYDEIVAALGVSKSSVSLWVRDLPKPPTPPERLHRMSEARWAPYRAERDRQRKETKEAARAEGVYLGWLAHLGVSPERLAFHLMIHESADIAAAERYWADLVGVGVDQLGKTTIKKHNPKTVRKNVGEDYRGCLTVRTRQGAELYRRIEGWWDGIADHFPGESGRV
jgi:hypothetical protein